MKFSAAISFIYLALLASIGFLVHALAKFVVHGFGSWAGWVMVAAVLLFAKWFGDKYDM
jgi:hypothetical protein